MHESVFSDAVFLVAMLVIALFSSLLGCIAREAQTIPRFVQWIRKRPVLGVAIVATLLSLGPITLRSKNGPLSFSRPSAPQTSAPVSALEPSYGVVSVHTNAVSLRAATSKALEQTAWRLHGASDTGFWLEAEKPFFMEGTNPVSRVYVSAGGSISVGSTRRPPVGSTLPDGTGATVLCPLRAAVGVVPEANWGLLQTESGQPETGNDGGSRFWHESLPGGGMLLTWENALLDRLPDRRVTMRAELQPTGDFICRYDFKDELVPAPTNLSPTASPSPPSSARTGSFAPRRPSPWSGGTSRPTGISRLTPMATGFHRMTKSSSTTPIRSSRTPTPTASQTTWS